MNEMIVLSADQVAEIVTNAVRSALHEANPNPVEVKQSKMPDDFPQNMNFQEARDYLSVHGCKFTDTGLYNKVNKREITCRKAGNRLVFSRSDLDNFLAAYITKRADPTEHLRAVAIGRK